MQPARLLAKLGDKPTGVVGENNHNERSEMTEEITGGETAQNLFEMLERWERPNSEELQSALTEALANLDQFEEKFRELRSTVTALRNEKNWAEQQRDRANTQQRHYIGQFQGVEELLQREREFLTPLIEQAHAGEEKFSMESPQVECYLEIAYRAGIFAGQHAEAHRLAVEIDDYRTGQREKFDEIARALRTPEGSFPDPISIPEAVAKAIRAVRPSVHSLDPRLSEFWEKLHELAKRNAGFCEVYDRMCEALGTPEVPYQTKSGTITVRATIDVEVPISGAPVDEHGSAEYDIDSSDVLGALDLYSGVNDWEILDEDLDWD